MCKKLIYLMLVFVVALLADMANADITTDLMGYWKLDGNANDSSGNNYHGEEYGNPSYVPGMIGQAMEFNGTDQSVYIPDFTAVQNQDEVTVCMWVKPDRNTGSDQMMWFTDEDGSYGRADFGINGDEWEWKHGGDGGNTNVDDSENPIILGEWVHLAAIRKNNDRLELFVDGISVDQTSFGVAGVAEPQGSIGAERRSPTSVRNPFDGVIDEVRFYTRALSAADIKELFTFTGAPPMVASNPNPADEAEDVPRDTVLSWTPGDFTPAVNGHTVYLSENFNDVNDGIGGIAQDANSYVPGRLAFGTTYYWRVDEVNGPPDFTIFEGDVWSFTVEPIAYAIENVTATASSNEVGKGPENTVNGSGLDANDLHSMEPTNMWLSGNEPLGAWIEFQFDKVHKVYQMWVWNSNDGLEPVIGFGLKGVTIEYSVNGTDYTTLGTTHEFAQAPGTSDYAHNTTVDFSGVAAKYIKLTANSNWGGILSQYGLSEVRFFYIPVWAREPEPDSGATDVEPDVTLGFRAGREAAEHDVYFSTDEQAVIDGTAPVISVTEASHGPLDLDLAQTYYWKIDEVNEAESPTTWDGEVWNFTTPDFLIVDDFESYNDLDPDDPESNRIFLTWLDGYEVPTNGSLVGYDAAPFAEQTIVHGGGQSMPLSYDNSGTARYSEAERTLSPAQDWTKHGVKALSLWFHGDPNNAAEQIYVKVNGSKVVYDGNAADIKQTSWQQWNVDLASFAVDLRNVTKLSIGVGDETSATPGGSGVMYVDDIRLYPSRCVLSRLSADFAKLDYVENCVVDYGEFEVMAGQWLFEELIPGGAGEIWIEAESADSITEPMKIYDDPSASGGQYIGTDQGIGNQFQDSPPTPAGTATYTFTVAGGIYKISCRIIIPSGDSFWVRIPGATNLTPGEHPGNPGTGWVRWFDPDDSDNWYWADVFSGDHDDEVVNWTLPAGTHTLEIARREDGALLDRFVITDNLNLDPVILSPLAADLNEDKRVDFKDYAILADSWLDEQLWPAP